MEQPIQLSESNRAEGPGLEESPIDTMHTCSKCNKEDSYKLIRRLDHDFFSLNCKCGEVFVITIAKLNNI